MGGYHRQLMSLELTRLSLPADESLNPEAKATAAFSVVVAGQTLTVKGRGWHGEVSVPRADTEKDTWARGLRGRNKGLFP